MHEGSRSTPLGANLRQGRPPFRVRRLSRRAWWMLVVTGGAVLFAISAVLERIAPGTGVALGLGLRWIIAAAYLGCVALAWRIPELGWRWRLGLAGAAAFFVIRAAIETSVALG